MENPHRQAELQLAELRQQLASGKLDQNAFQAAVAALRAVDAAGATWQLSPEGNWLRWDGGQWLPGDPHGDQFDDAAARFRTLQTQRAAGQIDEAGYAAAVGGIRIEEADGSQWSVHPQSGAWLRWDGSAWQEAEPPRRGADGRPALRPSVFIEFEELYKGLIELLEQGKISREEFDARIAKLRVTDEEGAWWQISPETGGWLKWDGQSWAPAQPPRETVSAVGPARKLAQTVVESTKEELKATAKSLPRMIFRMVASRAIMFVIAFLTARYLNAYWSGYKNDGFRDDGGPWAPWLFLTESQHGNSYAFIWGMGGMLFGTLVQSMISRGPVRGFVGMMRSPFAMFARLKDTGKLGFGALILGAGASLLVGSRLPINPQASLSLAIGLLFAGAGRPGYYFAKFLFGIVRRVITPSVATLKGKFPIDLRVVQMAVLGVAPGFYLASKLSDPSKPLEHGNLLIYGAVLTGVGVWLTFFSKKRLSSESLATMLLGGVFGLAAMIVIDLLHPLVAHADDGGADEFSGDPNDYWKTEGGKLLEHSKPPGEAAGIGAVLGVDTKDGDEEDEKKYSYSLSLDHYSMTLTKSTEEIVCAYVRVSGPDPVVCAQQEASLNAAIRMGMTGNIVEWFTPTIEADSSGARCKFWVEVPEDPDQRKGPNVAYVSARVSTPKGALSARCRINMEVQSDYALIMDAELKVKANESNSALYAYVQCNDPALDGSEQLEKSRALAPLIKFTLSGDQANWVGGPGPVEGYVSADGKEIPVAPVVPAQDVNSSPPFLSEVEVSCDVPEVGTLTRGGRIVIEPPDWFVELEVIKSKMMLGMKDAASFKVRLIPLDSSKLELYTSESGNMLNAYLSIAAEGGNAAYAVFSEKEGDGEWRLFEVTFSEAASGVEVEPFLDIVAEAELTGTRLSQKFRIDLAGKPSLEVTEKAVGMRPGGDPVDIHCKVKDAGDLEWGLQFETIGMDEVTPTGDPVEGEGASFTLSLQASSSEGMDLKLRTGKLSLRAKATNPDTNEEIVTDPVEVELKLGQVGLTVVPPTIRLPLDPTKEPATFFKVRVVQLDPETGNFSTDAGAMQGLEIGDWEEGDYPDGQNAFLGSKAELKYERTEGSGVDAVAVWSVKQKVMVPASQAIDALRTLTAPGEWGEDSDLFEIEAKFILPVDPASMESAKIRLEQQNCRKILKYMPEGEQKQKFVETVETKAQALGAEGLFHLRHQIWTAAQDALLKEAESYMASAVYYDRIVVALDWTNYLAGLIVQGMSSVLVPFPGDMLVNLLYQAIPELALALYEGGPTAGVNWCKQWANGIVSGAGGMAVDMAIGQVVNLEALFLKGMAVYKDPRKAGLIASVIFFEAKFARYQITSKPDGEPYSVKESIVNSLRDLAEEIVTCGISKGTKYKQEGPGHGYDAKDGRHYGEGDGPPDTKGMPDANIEAMKKIAKMNNVEIYVRPTNPASKKLLEEGAHPKPESLKSKTINAEDVKLGCNAGDKGKVGYFDPGEHPPAKGSMSDADHAKLVERYKQRKQEFADNAHDMEKLKAKGDIEIDEKTGVITKKSDGKPYTGDHDVFDIRGPGGRKLTDLEMKRVMDQLMKPPFSAQHGGHRQWDYSKEDKKTPKPYLDENGNLVQPQSKFAKNKKIDEKILDSHQATTSKGEPGEGLIKVDRNGKLSNQHLDTHTKTLDKRGKLTQSVTSTGRHDQEEKNR